MLLMRKSFRLSSLIRSAAVCKQPLSSVYVVVIPCCCVACSTCLGINTGSGSAC